ncbi:CAAX prenyl protease 2 isoform X2 [Amyelois transitella]|uniref:CAAX prenyl protease 2 isoform X2 n=1 Tax=Amyelois transitella TaxID=680683 RepID=UPI0029900137|nr:CAAX prenyl protease 2 isoform X2 [Amyelois transitella]
MKMVPEFLLDYNSSCMASVFACIFLTCSYVASLYVWRSPKNRDHPSTIKKRFFSVFCMMLLAPFITRNFLSEESSSKGTFFEHMGLRMSGLITATFAPLFLTSVLFLGPLCMQYFSGLLKLYAEPMYWLHNWQDLVWIRNHIMAPLSEEWVFRACMMPLLMECLQPFMAIFTGPLLFGIAHFHHMLEQMKSGYDVRSALFVSSFQFSYTSIFGAYSSYLFLRTGHFVAPLLAHIFCNHMGFPNFSGVLCFPPIERAIIIFSFVLGLVLWCVLLVPITNPDLYDNKIYRDVNFQINLFT